MGFPGTLYQAFDLKGLATPPGPLMHAIETDLDPDPQRRLEQTLYLAAVAVNKLRHAQGVGHGRPFPPTVSVYKRRQRSTRWRSSANCYSRLHEEIHSGQATRRPSAASSLTQYIASQFDPGLSWSDLTGGRDRSP